MAGALIERGWEGQRIRQDRILSEADATGADIRGLCDLFGIAIAYRYSASAPIDTNCGPEPGPARR